MEPRHFHDTIINPNTLEEYMDTMHGIHPDERPEPGACKKAPTVFCMSLETHHNHFYLRGDKLCWCMGYEEEMDQPPFVRLLNSIKNSPTVKIDWEDFEDERS